MGEEGPDIVLSLDFGPHAGDLVTFLARLQREADPNGRTIQQSEKDGRVRWTIETGGPRIAGTLSDTTLVFATSEALLDQTLRGATEGTLATSADFQATRRKVAGDSTAFLAYASVAGLLEQFGSEMPREAKAAFSAMGIDAITSIAYGLSFAGDGFADSFVLRARDSNRGMLRMMKAKPIGDRSFLPFAPAGAFLFAEASLALPEMFGAIRDMVAVEPRALRELDEGLQQMKSALGVDVEKELVGGLGEGYGYYAAVPSTGGVFPEVGVMLRVKDPASYEGVFERFAKGLAGILNEEGDVVASTRTVEYRGKRLHLFEMQAARGDDPVPFTPTWALLDDVLVVTLVPHTMKEIVLRRTGGAEGETGLAGEKDFQSVMAHKPEGANSVSYIDTAGLMGLLYDTGVPLLQTLVKPNMLKDLPFRLDWSALPAARTVKPYWRSFGGFGASTEDGMTSSLHGPVPVMPLMVVAVGAATLGMTRAMGMRGERRSAARAAPFPGGDMGDIDRALAEVQVEELHGKVEMYLLDKSALPKDLSVLVQAELLERVPADPWGRAFRLRVLDDAAKKFAVESSGADGAFGTADDVSSATAR
jgi:hypothetical protein